MEGEGIKMNINKTTNNEYSKAKTDHQINAKRKKLQQVEIGIVINHENIIEEKINARTEATNRPSEQ